MSYFELRKQLKSIPEWHIVEIHYEWTNQPIAETCDEVYLTMPGVDGMRYCYIHGRVDDREWKPLGHDYQVLADDFDLVNVTDIMDHGKWDEHEDHRDR